MTGYPPEFALYANALKKLRFDHVEVLIERGIPVIAERGAPGVAMVGRQPAVASIERAAAIVVMQFLSVVEVVEGNTRVRPMPHVPHWPNTAKKISKGAKRLGRAGGPGIMFIVERATPAIHDQIETRQGDRSWAETGEEVARSSMLWFLGTLLSGLDPEAPAVFGWGEAATALPARLGVTPFPEPSGG